MLSHRLDVREDRRLEPRCWQSQDRVLPRARALALEPEVPDREPHGLQYNRQVICRQGTPDVIGRASHPCNRLSSACRDDRVLSYAKNDRLDFNILYEWEGSTHPYIPDFLVRLKMGGGPDITLVLETKGHEREQDRAKYAAAEKWVRAVNHHGGYGTWAFMVCKEPNRLGQMLDEFKLATAA